MNEIVIHGYGKRKLAENWDEIRPDSLLNFVVEKLVTEPDFLKARLIILQKLLKLPKSIFLNIDPEHMTQLVELLSWMDIRHNSTMIYQEYKIKNIAYRLPGHNFEVGTAFQFAAGADYYTKYIETKQDTHLHHLCSTLLYDEEPLHNKENIEDRSSIFWNLPAIQKMTVATYFGAVQQLVADRFGDWLFSGEEGEGSPGISFGWWGVYMDIAESGVFGDLRGVYQARFYDIVIFLIQKKEQFEALKKAQKTQST
jgi:hypothetical protein